MKTGSGSLGLGLIIGLSIGASVLLLAFFAVTVVPGQRRMGAPVPTSEAILAVPNTVGPPTETPTFTPIPSAQAPANLPAGYDFSEGPTPDPLADRILAGDIIFAGPLSTETQVALYRAAMRYSQATIADSKRVAKEINGVGYGDPSNICGPLAIAILRDAGVIASDVVPHDYWLLDPGQVLDRRLLSAAFPSERFTHQKMSTQLNRVDWTVAPLVPGDFLFIWHGSWGNFDHMLTVSRVDTGGRAYAVTNFGTPDGYMIAEVMLYDPADANAGIFRTWTKERDQILGSTGFGGFEIWRALPQ